ncbi:hypothetical protein [Streptomyces sp. NPDC002779]|uniref:hypothetical protein n=1 Tax=Streptomyces sp. NPDC002779 TaxID=3364664 RepID=UPI0036A600F5
MPGRYLLLEQGKLTEALPHIQRAAEAGSREPAQELGFLLLARALHWLGVAAEHGNPAAAEALPALRAALTDQRLLSALAPHTPDPTPPSPGPPLSAGRAITHALDEIRARNPTTQ